MVWWGGGVRGVPEPEGAQALDAAADNRLHAVSQRVPRVRPRRREVRHRNPPAGLSGLWLGQCRGGAVNEDKMHDDHGGPVDLEVKFLDLCLYWAAGHDTPPNGLVQGNTG